WCQLALSNDALVGLSDVFDLVFKFAVVLWQPFDDNIRSVWHVQPNRSCRKQTLTNLELVLRHSTITSALRHCDNAGPAHRCHQQHIVRPNPGLKAAGVCHRMISTTNE